MSDAFNRDDFPEPMIKKKSAPEWDEQVPRE